MKWHDYIPTISTLRKVIPECRNFSNEKLHQFLILSHTERHNRVVKFQRPKFSRAIFETEWLWMREGRPYYRVWPGIFEALQKLQFGKVDSGVCVIPQNLNTLAVSLCEPLEVVYKNIPKPCHVLIMGIDQGWFELTIDIGVREDEVPGNQMPDIIRFGFPIEPGKTIEEQLTKTRFQMASMDENRLDVVFALLRLCIGLTMIHDDPDILNPSVLEDDRRKWEQGDDEVKRRLEDKAKRRGKVVWDIGRGMYEKRDVSAHYRHPHFAIRWMGRKTNDKKPVLRHISGSFVHRDKMTQVPTGYLDDEEKDVETEASRT